MIESALVNCYYCGVDIWFMDCEWLDENFNEVCESSTDEKNEYGIHTPTKVSD